MFSIRNLKIKNKLTAIIMIVSSVAVLLAGSIFITFSTYTLRANLARELTSLATVIGNNCKVILEFNVHEDGQKVLSTLEARPSIVFAGIYDSNGEIISIYRHHVFGDVLQPPDKQENSHVFTNGFLHIFHYVRVNDMVVGTIYFQDDMSQVYTDIIYDVTILILIMLVALAAAYIISSRLQKMISGPILTLADIAKMISEKKDYSIRADKESTDEVGNLIDAFNEMLFNIQNRDLAIRESERKYRTLIENIPQKIFYKDKNSVYVTSNEKYARDLNITPDKIAGKSDFNFFPEELAKKYILDDRRIMQSEKTEEIEEKYLQGDREFTVQTIKTPIRDENNNIIGLLGIFWDITDRKQAEEDLKKAQNYISNIINSMPSVLVGVDINGRVTQWNKTAEKNTGITAGEAQGKSLTDVFPQMVSEMKKITKSIRTQETQHEQKKPRLSKEGTLYEDVTIYPLVTNGVEGVVIRIDEVTDKVRMEEMMIQSEKMLSVGGLAAGMAHEINNPLAGMMQTADVMNQRLIDMEMPANRRIAEEVGIDMEGLKAFMKKRGILRMISTINESGQRVADIVDNMLSFARKSDSSISTHDIADLIDKTIELASTDYDLKKQYDFKTIKIIKKYSDNVPSVPCEGAKIQQVLLNIFRNGAQAMQEAGIEKPLFNVRTKFEKELKMVGMEIEDNGPGIDEETRKRIFEPFYTTKPVGVGTGLGLSVSYFIITENHGGEMFVESQPGYGAKFIIRLPVQYTLSDSTLDVKKEE